MNKPTYLLLFLFAFNACFAQVRLPKLVSDSMILQRDVPTKIWGWAAKGEQVSLSFNKKKYEVKTGEDGKWFITLPAIKAGGPYDIDIDASNHLSVKNILFGDVWVCSGQSNMEQPMQRVMDTYPDEIKNANNFYIRKFSSSTNYNFHEPQEDLPSGKWSTVNSSSIYQFYAIAYFFAKDLYEKYKVPIGLIQTAVGGSPAEAWISEEAVGQFPAHLQLLAKLKDDNYVDSIRKNDSKQNESWYRNIWQKDSGLQTEIKWYEPQFDAKDWDTMSIPGYWSDKGLKTNGVVWFRKEILVPKSMTNKPARLFLGNIIDRDSVFVNGQFAGTTGYQYPPRKYDLKAGLLTEGKNVIVVRIINSAGNGGFYPDKPYRIKAGNDSIDLRGEWKYKLGVASRPAVSSTTFHYQPVGLFNGMIAPLINLPIKGVIWYQGESNTGRPAEYHTLFPALIADWRAKWKQGNFPFLFVQLANYMKTTAQPVESNWAKLREAQAKTLSIPNTAMAVAIDLGEWNDVHPVNKKDVGLRLSLAAQKLAYGNNRVVHSGPSYKDMKIEGNKISLSFDNIGKGLVAKGGTLKFFSISGADKKFVWANAKIKGDRVVVWNDEIFNPIAVRYAWADNPEGANLYNKEGLPASPFRTDDK